MENGVKLGFVCVQNAGRSQMAAAFAEREREARGVEDAVEILTGGTDPETVRAIREEVERRVSDLFEESVGEA
jgi:protein-tyrosine-phosphatase